jgi:hypothetical protein
MVSRSTPATFWDSACALLMDVANTRLSGDYSHANVNVISLIQRMHIIHAWTTKFCSDD